MQKTIIFYGVFILILGLLVTVSCIVVDTPTNYTVGSTTSHTISSTTTTTGTIATIDGEFPAGFDVSGATLGAVAGISAGTISVAGQVVTYTVTIPVPVPSGTNITIELSSIINATVVGSYAVTVTTRNAVGTIIDGPTTSLSFTLIPAAASSIEISGITDPITAGTASDVTMTARDPYGNIATSYTGTVTFTSTDTQSTLPADYTFLPGDAGVKTLAGAVTLRTAGEQSVTATDTITSTITGSQTSITVIAGVPTSLNVITSGGGTETAGAAFDVILTALDDYGNTATSYAGATVSIDFTSTATAAPDSTLPTIPTPQILDFSVTPGIATATGFILVNIGETPTITATDGIITGVSAAIVVNATIDHYSVTSVSSPQTTGIPFSVIIQAQDQYNNNITSGAEAAEIVNVSFSLADPGATPTSIVTTNGTATVNMTMTVTQVNQTIIFTGATSGMTGISNAFTVNVGGIDHYSVTAISPHQIIGRPFIVTIQAQDQYNNNIKNGTDAAEIVNISFGLADPGATPTSTTTNNGTATVNMTMTKIQTGQIIIFTGASSGKQGISNAFTVGTGALGYYSVTPIGATQIAGESFSVTIQAKDYYNNDITSGPGSSEKVYVIFALADGKAKPKTITTTNGAATVNITMTVPQSGQFITFTGASSLITGVSNSYTVNAGAIDHYEVKLIRPSQEAGTPISVIIQAKDQYNNDITSGADAAETVNISTGLVDAGVMPISTTTTNGTAKVTMAMTVPQAGQTIIVKGGKSGKQGISSEFMVKEVESDNPVEPIETPETTISPSPTVISPSTPMSALPPTIETYPMPPPPSSTRNNWPIAGGIIGGVVIVGLIVFLIRNYAIKPR